MMEMVNTYGQIQLSVRADNETTISVHVVKAAYLKSSLPFANATVAAGLIPVTDGCRRNPQTSTVVCSNNPSFNEILTVDIGRRTGRSRLFVAVWCKQSDRKSMELIGAMSFSLKQCLTQPFSGWYYLLEEHLGMSKSLQCGSPSDPPTGRRLQSEEMLYQNTTETHYKQPRRFPLSSLQPHNLPDRPGVHGTETYSRCRVRKLRASKEPPSDSQPSSRDRPSSRTRSPHTQLSSRAPAMDNRRSYRAPAPDSRPPPVPGVSQCWTTQGDVYTESERIYHTAGHYGTYTTSDNTGSLDRRYKQPSQSLYKLPARRDVGSEEHLYMNMQELARFDQPVSVTGSHDSSCSSSRSSLLDDLRSVQSSTRSSTIGSARESVRSGSVRSGSIRGSSVRSMYAYKGDTLYKKTSEGLIKVGNRPIKQHKSLRRIKKQSKSHLMMSPNSSQSSSDSQAAWAKLNSGGKKYTPLLFKICRGTNGFGFSLTDDSPVGVCQVEAGSSAEKAGLQENDRIVEVEKEDVINTSTQQLAAIIRHQQKTMEVVVWREVSTQRVQRTGSQRTDRQTPCKTPVKRSGSKLSGLGSARKKYKQQCKERKAKGRRDGVADGATVSEKKALKMVAYLHEIEGEFCDTVERSRCYYVSQLQQSGQLDEGNMATLFQNIDMLISMSRYFAAKLEIVVRQADKKMIATAPEIYLPRIEVLKQNYLKYVEGVEKAEGVRLLLAEGLSVPSPEQDDILLLDELIYSPLHHIQKVAAAFSLFLQSVGDKDPSLPHVQRISSELRECCELIESYSQVSQPQFQSPAKSKSGPLDPEVAEIEERLEFPPHVKEFTLCEPNRHKIYWSEVKVIGVKHKLVAYLFSDIILVARQRGWRDSKLAVAMDPVNLCDIIDVDYGAEGSDGVFEIKLHYMSMPDQELCTLTMVCLDLETKLVWKGLLRDRLVRHTPPTEHSLSDQGIQVSESSECTEGDEVCCEGLESFPLKLRPSFTDSMMAMADDLCSTQQLRNVSGNSGETTSDCLHLADYTKQEAKQAITVPVSANNNNSTLKDSAAPELPRRSQDEGCYRVAPIDLSAITEEGEELTSTSMHLSCSREPTLSDFVSTPKDKSTISSRSPMTNGEPSSAQGASSVEFETLLPVQDESADANHSLNYKSFSNPELSTDDITSQSLTGYGEEMCSPTGSAKQTISSSCANTRDNSTADSSYREATMTPDANMSALTYDSQRCSLPCQPAKASFTFGDSPPPSLPGSPTSCESPPSLQHRKSYAKLLTKSPVQRKTLSGLMRRSKSYTTPDSVLTTPTHTKFLQQQMNQLAFDQSASKGDVRQRKFSAVAKNVRNVLSFFKKRPSDANTPAPPVEVIQSWTLTITNLLKDKYGVMLFKNFLRSEYSEENIDFWEACEEYRQLKPKQFAARAQKIYSEYVTAHAPREVNLDCKTRLETMKNLNNPDKETFDLAQSKIQGLMEKDSYPRFLKSSVYTDLISELASPGGSAND